MHSSATQAGGSCRLPNTSEPSEKTWAKCILEMNAGTCHLKKGKETKRKAVYEDIAETTFHHPMDESKATITA